MEKDCAWYFGKEGGIDIGPNDPIHQTFKGNPYYSIVREAIQNSLDAVNNDELPVKVAFEYFKLDKSEYPSFFKLEDHINQSLEYYKDNNDAKRLFGDMIKYLSRLDDKQNKLTISCLRISDSNTKGMNYGDGTNSPFYAFLRAAGVSAKKLSGSGGSFGFGKGAYFALSPIKTLIVSTKDLGGSVFFEGATRLTTHKNSNGDKLTAYGFYDNNKGEPVVIEDKIPDIFRRSETGTDINIIGLWDEVDRNTLMIKSVLNNFWLAIHENKLAVVIDNITIGKDNLEQIIDLYYPTEYESGSATEIELWNPKPYFKAVKYGGVSDQFQIFIDTLPTLGNVSMYVYLEKGLPNRTSFFRKPKMVVYKKTNRKINGYAAVFICENETGNDILRLMENPAHNEWNKENYPNDEGRIDRVARKAEKEVSDYINQKLDSLAKLNTSKKVSFLGLEEFLSIPEDLLENDEESDLSGKNDSTFFGKPSKDLSDDETGLQTTNYAPINIKPTIKGQSQLKDNNNRDVNINGSERIITGDNNEEEGGNMQGINNGPKIQVGEQSNNPSASSVLVKVRLKVAAQFEGGLLYHNLIITSDKNIPKTVIELFVSGDNDRDDGVEIVMCDNGKVQKNILKDVVLSAGKNNIKIRFADNLKHSIKIKAYELQ